MFFFQFKAFVSTLKEKQETRVGIVDLHPDIFRVSPRIDILHQNVVWQQKYRNVILTKQLTRAEMPGGGRKPWPQKRTGRSHAGSIRTHQFIRGGFSKGVRGPTNFFYILPNQKRIMGLCTALTIKLAQNGVQFVDSLNEFPENDPKFLFDMAEERNWGYSVLFINDNDKVGSNLVACCEEYPWFNIMPIYGLNVFSILKYDTVILSIPALKILEERLLKHMHQTGPINKKFKYIEWKERILNEAEGEDHPKWTPFV
ncbi:hypothetical protein WR25_22325 [Diploscapter pachys]|uniref:Large ribosomal subunit protein uL4m n=1 Tax=Diploscapter pachys TaxID=2018661 RepID=A0A2A2L156_9BILA|nr:hypothetical protein WR25_22325 [Diploscapter pachys]